MGSDFKQFLNEASSNLISLLKEEEITRKNNPIQESIEEEYLKIKQAEILSSKILELSNKNIYDDQFKLKKQFNKKRRFEFKRASYLSEFAT